MVCKIYLIPSLYFNQHYYGIIHKFLNSGQLFIIFDSLSGPLSLVMNCLAFQDTMLTYGDILVLFRIFCMEKIRLPPEMNIRLLIKDVLYILYVARYINMSIYLTYYVYSYVAYRLFGSISPAYFRNVYISMLSMFQVYNMFKHH